MRSGGRGGLVKRILTTCLAVGGVFFPGCGTTLPIPPVNMPSVRDVESLDPTGTDPQEVQTGKVYSNESVYVPVFGRSGISGAELVVSRCYGLNDHSVALIKFPKSKLKYFQGRTINKAELNLTFTGFEESVDGIYELEIGANQRSWKPSDADGRSWRIGIETRRDSVLFPVDGVGRESYNITQIVSDWVEDPAGNNGLVIQLVNRWDSVVRHPRDSWDYEPPKYGGLVNCFDERDGGRLTFVAAGQGSSSPSIVITCQGDPDSTAPL